jgi:hypothetical protein
MTFDSRARLICLLGVTVIAALALAALLPTKWVPRTGLGWQVEHFLGYFVTTLVLSVAWHRPYVVAASLMMCSGLLEALQGLTPDRTPDLTAAFTGAAGVISAATLVMLSIRGRKVAQGVSSLFPSPNGGLIPGTPPFNARDPEPIAALVAQRRVGGLPLNEATYFASGSTILRVIV